MAENWFTKSGFWEHFVGLSSENSKTQSSLNILRSRPRKFTKSDFSGLAPIRWVLISANIDGEFFGLVFPGFQAPHKKSGQNSLLKLSTFLSNFTFSNPFVFVHVDSPSFFSLVFSKKKTKENPRNTKDFSRHANPQKILQNKQKTLKKTKEFRSKKNTKETKTPSKRRTGFCAYGGDHDLKLQ